MGDGVERQPEDPVATASYVSTVPNLQDLFLSFLRLGSVSFGGPAMVAYIKRLSVSGRAWLSDRDFDEGVALCQAVPGATAMQCAAYVGLRTRGLAGAVAAYVGFGLPAFVLMLTLSIAYRHAIDVRAVSAALTGLRVIVVALVANAAWTFGSSSVNGIREGAIAAVTAGLFFFGCNPFLIVVGAGIAGTLLLGGKIGPVEAKPNLPPGWRALAAPALVLGIAAALIGVLLVLDRRLAILGLVMMKVDAFAFGGGFASVPLMCREVVDVRGWMPLTSFLDGIALGQVTPGPIVITATFVGHQVEGVAGAVVATVCIFLPSLFMVLLAAPWFHHLRTSTVFRGAVRAMVLSFVGLLASVTIHFAQGVTWDLPSGAIAAGALVALFIKVDVLWVVLAGAVLSALIL